MIIFTTIDKCTLTLLILHQSSEIQRYESKIGVKIGRVKYISTTSIALDYYLFL